MRGKILGFLLIASLALNVSFVAGVFEPRLAVWPHFFGRPHEPRGDEVVAAAAEDFSLNDQEVAALEALRQRIADQRRNTRGARDGFRTVILDALAQPTFDRAALAQALDQQRSSMGDMILDMTADLHGFLSQLTPEQKTAFLQRARDDRDFLRRLLFPPPPRRDGDRD